MDPYIPPLLPQGEERAKQSAMPPDHGLYQALSRSARTAATLAPSVMLDPASVRGCPC